VYVADLKLFPSSLPVKPSKRPPVSLSMSGHCRMELWLAGHGREPEKVDVKTQRIFDVGHLTESAVFDTVKIWDPETQAAHDIGPWWPTLGELYDPTTGEMIDLSRAEANDRQREVEVAGYKGHIDAVTKVGEFFVVDTKTMSSISWRYSQKKNYSTDVFGKEYLAQQTMYMEGLRLQGGIAPERAFLLCYNRDSLEFYVRFLDYYKSVVDDSLERLSWASSEKPPEPDHEWQKGHEVPLRCAYCNFKASCAEQRGEGLYRTGKGEGKWVVS
jgi:hypothetical protein